MKLQLVEKLVAARSSRKNFVAVAVVATGFLFRVYLPERLAVRFDRALTALLSVGRRVAMKVLRLATRVFMALVTHCAAKVLNAESEAQPFC